MKNYRNWTKEETEYLKENHDKLSVSVMAEKLGRPKNSIKGKIYIEGWGRTSPITQTSAKKFSTKVEDFGFYRVITHISI